MKKLLLLVALTGLALASGCKKDDPKPVAVSGVTLNKSILPLMAGGTETLTATVTPDDAANKAVTWSSNNAAVATVNNGTVTAIAAGSATITVTTVDGNKTAACEVTVSPVTVESIAITTPPTQITYGIGEPLNLADLVVTATYNNSTSGTVPVTGANITGYNAATAGTQTLTVTVAGKTATFDVTVQTLAARIAAALGTAATITLYADESSAPITISAADTDITLAGDGAERTVTLSENGSLFTLSLSAKLTLGNNVTLQGKAGNTNAVVQATNTTELTMKAGAKITGNSSTATGVAAGGVYLTGDATFIMEGGTITGNHAQGNYASGGAYASNYVHFTMSGGEISGNSGTGISGAAGGVYTGSSNYMTKTGGVIAGVAAGGYNDNEALGTAANKGNAVLFNTGSFVYKKVDGDVTGNLSTSDLTTGWD